MCIIRDEIYRWPIFVANIDIDGLPVTLLNYQLTIYFNNIYLLLSKTLITYRFSDKFILLKVLCSNPLLKLNPTLINNFPRIYLHINPFGNLL